LANRSVLDFAILMKWRGGSFDVFSKALKFELAIRQWSWV